MGKSETLAHGRVWDSAPAHPGKKVIAGRQLHLTPPAAAGRPRTSECSTPGRLYLGRSSFGAAEANTLLLSPFVGSCLAVWLQHSPDINVSLRKRESIEKAAGTHGDAPGLASFTRLHLHGSYRSATQPQRAKPQPWGCQHGCLRSQPCFTRGEPGTEAAPGLLRSLGWVSVWRRFCLWNGNRRPVKGAPAQWRVTAHSQAHWKPTCTTRTWWVLNKSSRNVVSNPSCAQAATENAFALWLLTWMKDFVSPWLPQGKALGPEGPWWQGSHIRNSIKGIKHKTKGAATTEAPPKLHDQRSMETQSSCSRKLGQPGHRPGQS